MEAKNTVSQLPREQLQPPWRPYRFRRTPGAFGGNARLSLLPHKLSIKTY